MLFLKSFLDRFFFDFGRVWEAFWPFLAALGALWDDFWASFLNYFLLLFVPMLLEGSGLAFGGHGPRFWRVLGSFFRDFGPLGRRNAGTDFELKTQAIPVAVQDDFMQF